MTDNQRNLNPTPEARLAMSMWPHEYAFEQHGGTMDFWEGLDESRKRIVRHVLSDIAKAAKAHGHTLSTLEHRHD